jgi:AFG3 family protein
MSFRLSSIRRLAQSSSSFRPAIGARLYATPSSAPRPSRNSPTPEGLESLFGGTKKASKKGKVVAPRPPGIDPPSGPSLPKKPDVGLPGQDGKGKEGEDAKEEEEEEESIPKRSKLSEKISGNAGHKVGTGGGGGSGGGGGPGGAGQWSPNQLLLFAISTYALWSLSGPSEPRSREITWQEL